MVAVAIFVGLLALLPLTLRALRKSARGNGRVTGVALGLGFVFATLFDPAKAAAIEEIEEKKEVGSAERSWGGQKF